MTDKYFWAGWSYDELSWKDPEQLQAARKALNMEPITLWHYRQHRPVWKPKWSFVGPGMMFPKNKNIKKIREYLRLMKYISNIVPLQKHQWDALLNPSSVDEEQKREVLRIINDYIALNPDQQYLLENPPIPVSTTRRWREHFKKLWRKNGELLRLLRRYARGWRRMSVPERAALAYQINQLLSQLNLKQIHLFPGLPPKGLWEKYVIPPDSGYEFFFR